jgi:hypothetical protein
MAFVDPDRFKRFEQFLSRHSGAFAAAASGGYAAMGKGAVVYRPPDDRLEGTSAGLRLEYKAKSEIDAAQGATRDELIQGILDRYQPPGEGVFVAIYPDGTYDVSRVVMTQPGQAPPAGPG